MAPADTESLKETLMAFDKVKTLRAAEKYLELGKIPAAIKEYCRIVEGEPEDYTTLNMLGDLYVRVGNSEQAIVSFTRIADHYRKQEFVLKAIAMYKKIDRLRPNDTEIAYTLATLYAQQDMVVEARAHFLQVANAYSRANEPVKALEVLRQIVDLDPQNTDTVIKLAEAYSKEGMKPEAVASFAEAGERLSARGAFDRALEQYTKALAIDPVDNASLKGLLATHNSRGTPDEAAEVIERASESNPGDVELLSLLATAYVDAEDAANAERTTAALVARDSFSYLRFVEVIRICLKDDKLIDAVRLMGEIADRMLAGRQDNQLIELINEILAVDSDNVAALRVLVRVYWNQRDREELKAALERLAEAAEAANLKLDERYALTQLSRLFPDEENYQERLGVLGGMDEEAAAEALPIFNSSNEPGGFPAFQTTGGQRPEETASDCPDTTSAETGWNELPEIIPAKESTCEFEIGFDLAVGQPADFSPTSESLADEGAAQRTRELESVDFYIAQGYVDIALDTLNLLEKQFGSHADIKIRRAQIDSLQTGTANKAEENLPALEFGVSEPEFDFPIVEQPPALVPETTEATFVFEPEPVTDDKPGSAAIDPGLAEIFEEFRFAEEGATGSNGDYETHYNLGLAYREMDLVEDAVKEFQTAVNLVRPSDGTPRYLQCCNLLGHCFLQQGVPRLAASWFSKGLSAPGHSNDEYQALRFDLGLAYEKMGEIDRALEIFTEIYGVDVGYREVKSKVQQLQNQIGAKPQSNHNSGHASTADNNGSR